MLPIPAPPRSVPSPLAVRAVDDDDTPVVSLHATRRADAPQGWDAWDVRRCVNALYRRRWLGAGVFALVVAAALAYISLATPIYEAHAKLLIESQNPNVVSFKEVMQQNTEKLDYYQTQLGILRSRTLARKTLDALHLWNHPEFQRTPSALGDMARRAMSVLGWRVAPVVPRDETTAQSRTIDAFLERLKISYRAENRLVDAGFRSTDPQLAALVANTIARAYIEQDLQLRLAASKNAAGFLNDRLAEQRKQVEASELALQRYREANSDVSFSDRENVVVQKLAELSTAATQAKAARIEAEAQYAQLQAAQRDPTGADTLPIVLSNPFIQQLKAELASLQREQTKLSERFGERHPQLQAVKTSIERVQQQLQGEIARLATSVRNQMLAAQAKEGGLAAAVQQQERVALGLNRRAIQDGVLQREVMSNRQIFEALLERAKQTSISSELKVTNIQIVDPAEVPELPASPAWRMILLLALLIGAPLAVVVVAGVEYMDERITSPDQITSALGLRFLGFSPTVRGGLRRTLAPGGGDDSPEFTEALRLVRANLFMCVPPLGTKTVLVTSTRPEEGKTSIAANLAVSLAQAGRRVLLVDADMRRCRIHQVFDVPVEPGLSAVLQGTVAMADAICQSHVQNLSILPAGMAGEAPGDLLELPGLGDAIAAMQHRFDWIIIDSPPVMAASDAIALAHVANAVVFVVGADMTSPRAAKAALEQLDGLQGKVVGAVLSRADLGRHSAYYGYYGYPGYYGPQQKRHRPRA